MATLIINKGNYNVPQLTIVGGLTDETDTVIGGREEYDELRSIFAKGGIALMDLQYTVSGTAHHFQGPVMINAVDESVENAFEFICYNLAGDTVPSDYLNVVHGNVYLTNVGNLKCKMTMTSLVGE